MFVTKDKFELPYEWSFFQIPSVQRLPTILAQSIEGENIWNLSKHVDYLIKKIF